MGNNLSCFERVMTPTEKEQAGIDDILMDPTEELYYDLNGRRVLNPNSGIHVTKSKKKVLFKPKK